jgi:C4-dicarboxylate transporter DctM subunit
VNAALFIIGMFIETSAAIIVLAPDPGAGGHALRHRPGALRPDHGGEPGLGMITPPFGVNLFAACTVARISLDRSSAPAALRAGDPGLPDGDHLRAGLSLTLRDLVYAK